MTVIIPSDDTETVESIRFAAVHPGPVYIRLTRSKVPKIYDVDKYYLNFPRAKLLKQGKDITLISNGDTMYQAVLCSNMLEEKGFSSDLISSPVVKPLDKDTIIQSASKTKAVMVIENHSIIGGLGTAVCEVLSENCPTIVKRIGTNDVFGQSGKDYELMEEYGLTAKKFIDEALSLIRKKINK